MNIRAGALRNGQAPLWPEDPPGEGICAQYRAQEAQRYCKNLLRYGSETRRGKRYAILLLGMLFDLGTWLSNLTETRTKDFFGLRPGGF